MELLLGLASTGMPCLVQYASRSDHPLKDSTNSGCFRWDHDNTVMMPKIKIMFSPSNSITASSTPPCWPPSGATSPQLSRLPAGPPLAQRVPSYHASLLAPFGYASLLWAVLIGALVFNETITAFTLLGAAVIAGSGLYLFRTAASGR